MPTTLHFAGTVDSSGIDYLIDGRNVLAEMLSANFGDGREIFVFHDGERACSGAATVESGSAAGDRMTGIPVCEVGGDAFDVLSILDDADGFPIDLTITDDPAYGTAEVTAHAGD